LTSVYSQASRIDDDFHVRFLDNGLVLEISYEDQNENWQSSKIYMRSLKDLHEHIEQICRAQKETLQFVSSDFYA